MGKSLRYIFAVLMLVLLAFFVFQRCRTPRIAGSYTMADEEVQPSQYEDEEESEESEEEDGTEDEEKGEGKEEENGPKPQVPAGPSVPPGNGGYSGGNDEEPVQPRYEYFEEGGMLICKGCYLPFPDVASLNAHECSGYVQHSCVHEWEAEYHDVWIPETGHWEEGIISDAYDEPVYAERCVCKKCGEYFLTTEEVANHIIEVHGNEGSWTVADVVVSYIHHDPVFGQVYVTDEAAHWEREVYRYRCILCGEIMYP